MLAMCLKSFHQQLQPVELEKPEPSDNEVLVRILACGVCRTDLHTIDGELPNTRLPVVPGHEIVGKVAAMGSNVRDMKIDDLVGVPWLAETCGHCKCCLSGKENLCDNAHFTGYDKNGGYAQYTLANSQFVVPLPSTIDPVSAAPLMCAGLIGWRSYRFCGSAERLGIYGFGAAGHIIAQIAVQQGRKVYAFTRPGDNSTQDFARELGAVWSGGSDERPPELLDAAIIFAPAGGLVPAALAVLGKGGTVVCGGIHMSDIPSFPYALLWQERSVRSVANLTRADAAEFIEALKKCSVETSTHIYDLKNANQALDDLRHGRFDGAAVLVPPG